MKTLISSFLYAGGPLFLICLLFSWLPFFYNATIWNDAHNNDPIKLGLKSSLYISASVAGISTSLPPCLELIFYIVVIRGNSIKSTILILINIFIFIFPELISLMVVLSSSSSDSKIYFLLVNNRISATVFFAMLLLCQFHKKSWKCKLTSFTVSFIYIGLLINSLAPYFDRIMGMWIQKFGTFLQLIGFILFVFKSYKFLLKNVVAKESYDLMIADYLMSKFITLSVLFIMGSTFCVYLGAGMPYWTEWNSTYITSYTIILALPNVLMGVAFAYATRNETIHLQHAKQMFINYISHEMRTPLNTAVMGLQYLRSELAKVEANDDIMITLDEVRVACDTSVSILTELLDFDKLQNGLMKMELEEVSVKEFLEDTISPFYVQAGLKDIVLEWNLDSPKMQHLFVSVDKSKFAQVIRNLLSNALKFTPTSGTVTITTTVTPYPSTISSSSHTAAVGVAVVGSTSITTSQQQLLTIAVTDTGAGISKENQKKLFKKMVQFNPGKLQSGGGTGLGLYISKGIMDLLHGTLSVKSEGEGHGCTFTIAILSKYMNNTNNELPEYKVDNDDDDDDDEERHAAMVGPAESDDYNDNSITNRTLRTSSIELSVNRFRSLRRTDSLRSIGSTSSKVAPLVRCDSARSSTFGSICAQNSQDDTQYDNSPIGISYSLKLLIVDDSKSNRKMLVRLLRSRCAVIGEAIDGIDAVNQIKEIVDEEKDDDEPSRQYDAILMDFIMPNMEGPEAAQEIRKLGYQGLIIGITGNVLPVDKERFISQGANIVLTKPVNINDIDSALANISHPTTATIPTITPTKSNHQLLPIDI